MASKDIFHALDVAVPTYAGAGPLVSCTDAAAFNTQFATSMDMQGYEGGMMVLYFADISNAVVYTFQVFESDTSATDAGTAVTDANQVTCHRDDNTNTEWSATTATLTLTGAASENHTYTFQYTGNKRWAQLTCGAGAGEDFTPGVLYIRAQGRRQPADI